MDEIAPVFTDGKHGVTLPSAQDYGLTALAAVLHLTAAHVVPPRCAGHLPGIDNFGARHFSRSL